MRIGLVRLSSLGDIIFCMAALQVIRRRRPDSQITWVSDKKFADILDHNPDLQQVVKVDLKGLKGNFSLRELKREYEGLQMHAPLDLVIDLHGMIKSAVIGRILGRHTCGFAARSAMEPLAALGYRTRFTLPLEMNTVHRYASLVGLALGQPVSEEELIDKQPFLFYAPEDREFSKDYFSSTLKNIILVVGSTWESRQYPKEKLVVVANALRGNILIPYGNQSEYEIACHIRDRSPHVTILPRLNLNQLKAAISSADLVIGGDTGPTHIAWANNVPCIVIFGPTPAHRIYPSATCRILKSSSTVREGRLNRHDFSINEISENQVIDLAMELLG